MSNIVEFPSSDRPISEDEIDRLHSEAFRDLEGRIMDCEAMAQIAAQLMANASTTDGLLVFAVCNCARMMKTLRIDYYAAWHGAKPIEP